MNGFVDRLDRPYDWRVLIEACIYTRRADFVHDDFGTYYRSLLASLQPFFDVDFSGNTLSFDQRILLGLFNSTIESLLQIRTPWSTYLEAGLLHKTLGKREEVERRVNDASVRIRQSNEESEEAHREMLATLFTTIFGERTQVVTSEQLLAAGFDDAEEPEISDYYEYM